MFIGRAHKSRRRIDRWGKARQGACDREIKIDAQLLNRCDIRYRTAIGRAVDDRIKHGEMDVLSVRHVIVRRIGMTQPKMTAELLLVQLSVVVCPRHRRMAHHQQLHQHDENAYVRHVERRFHSNRSGAHRSARQEKNPLTFDVRPDSAFCQLSPFGYRATRLLPSLTNPSGCLTASTAPGGACFPSSGKPSTSQPL